MSRVTLTNVKKQYGDLEVIHGIDLSCCSERRFQNYHFSVGIPILVRGTVQGDKDKRWS